MTIRRVTLIAVCFAALVSPSAALADAPTETSVLVESFDGTMIDINVCRPGSATAANPVPIILSSHGWGGSKSSCLDKTWFFNAGIGFVSMSQRGAGGSGGESHVMDPDHEGRDIMAIVDHIASLDWVAKDDGPGGEDPVLGAVGGSYGGGFQWVGAFSDQYFRGKPTRFNSLRPGNTWHDLRESLAPNGVMRTVIVSGLYAAGARSYSIAPWVHASMASSIATGRFIDGPAPLDFASELHQHGGAWFVERGQRLDIPVYVQQGAADLVFPLNEGLHNFTRALTPAARAASLFLNDQSGHGLPAQVPTGPVPYTPRSEDRCSTVSETDWFKHTLLGSPLPTGPGSLRMRTVAGACVYLNDLPAPTTVAVPGPWISTTGPRGVVNAAAIAQGPLRLAGIPTLSLDATTADPDARLFWGLAIGSTPESAQLVGGQWMPTRVEGPAIASEIQTELGGVVVDVPAGQSLYLVSSPAADQYAAHSSRTAGALVADNLVVGLPVVAP